MSGMDRCDGMAQIYVSDTDQHSRQRHRRAQTQIDADSKFERGANNMKMTLIGRGKKNLRGFRLSL